MALPFCAAISRSTSARSSRTRSKIPFTIWTAKAISPLAGPGIDLRCRGQFQPEKTVEIGRSDARNLVAAQVSHIRQRFRYLGDEGGLVALAAAPLRRQERRIGFRKNAVERQLAAPLEQGLHLRVGHVAHKRDKKAHLDAAPRTLELPVKQLKNP